MADVFLAVSHGPAGFNKLVVIKRLRAGLIDDKSVVAMFLDEAKLAARLTHANIVHTYEVGEHDGDYFIAMEYLDGQPLNRILTRGKALGAVAPEPVDLKIAHDALAGIHHAHEALDYDGTPLRVVHRDISPHNIFVTYQGEVKIVDFGIAKAVLNSSATEEGIVKGKVLYMAPEQAQGRKADRRVDVYAAGGVLWELLAGVRAVEGDAGAAMAALLANARVRDVRAAAPQVPEELAAIVARAMEPDPDKRFQTADDFRLALAAYATKEGRALASNEEVAEHVMRLFEDDRKEIQLRIREHLAKPASSSSSSRLIQLNPDGTTGTPPTGGHVSVVPGGSGEPRGRKEPWRAVLYGLLGAAVVVAAFNAVPSAQAPPPQSAPAPPAVPEMAEVTIHAVPADAVLTVDGVSVPNPYRAVVAKDSATHRVRASADGFVAQSMSTPFSQGLDLEIALEKAPDQAPAPSSSAAPPAAPRARPPPAPAKSAPPAASDHPPIKLRTER